MTREGPKMVAFCFVRIDIEIDQDGHFFSEIAKKTIDICRFSAGDI